MAVCPTLAALVTASPDVLSASISFLAPGKHIPVHRGPFRGVLRFYLVLSMPLAADERPAAVLKIAGTEHRLSDGEYLLWDDTFPHEVTNDSDEVRSVLLLDVWRRGMPLDMRISVAPDDIHRPLHGSLARCRWSDWLTNHHACLPFIAVSLVAIR